MVTCCHYDVSILLVTYDVCRYIVGVGSKDRKKYLQSLEYFFFFSNLFTYVVLSVCEMFTPFLEIYTFSTKKLI